MRGFDAGYLALVGNVHDEPLHRHGALVHIVVLEALSPHVLAQGSASAFHNQHFQGFYLVHLHWISCPHSGMRHSDAIRPLLRDTKLVGRVCITCVCNLCWAGGRAHLASAVKPEMEIPTCSSTLKTWAIDGRMSRFSLSSQTLSEK